MKEPKYDLNPYDDWYISKSELARRMDVSTRTIEMWMQKRKVPFEKIGKTVRFNWRDVRNYLARHNQGFRQVGNHLSPPEGTAARLRELAASIRQKQGGSVDGPASRSGSSAVSLVCNEQAQPTSGELGAMSDAQRPPEGLIQAPEPPQRIR